MIKLLTTLLLAVTLMGCATAQPKVVYKYIDTCLTKPPAVVPVRSCDSIRAAKDLVIQAKTDSLIKLRIQLDSTKQVLFLSNYKIEKVRYYLNITLRNSSQDKFLKGWIRRALQ